MNNIEANILSFMEALANYEYAYFIYIALAVLCLNIVVLIVLGEVEATQKDKRVVALEAKIDLLTKG